MALKHSSSSVLAALAAHAALAGLVAVLLVLHPPRHEEATVTFEVVHAAPLAPPPPPPTDVTNVADVPDDAPARAGAARRTRAPRFVAPAAEPAMPVAAPAEEAPVPAAALGTSVGSAAGVTFAPPAPPAPRPPREVARAEADATFVDSGYVRLETLVTSWQHNDGVRRCIETQLGSGERLAQLSESARGRMLDAVRRGDHDTALSEARRLHDAASSFDALYRRARHCLE